MVTHRKNNHELVMGVLANSTKPMTAYQILEHLKADGISGPSTVYRALEFLQERGFVHRLESINSFVACHHYEQEHLSLPLHSASFVLCNDCGEAEEIHDERMKNIFREWSDERGFSVTQQIVELLGLCQECKQEQKQRL